MHLFSSFASAGALLLLASNLPTTLAVRHVARDDEAVQPNNALTRREWYNNEARHMLDFHNNNQKRSLEAFKNRKRGDPWRPNHTYDSGFGHHEWTDYEPCDTTDRIKWSYGSLVRTITYYDSFGLRNWDSWANYSWYWTEKYYPRGQRECLMYGGERWDPHSASNINEQCKDKIYNPITRVSADRSPSNAHWGWTTNNATYNGNTVRTIWDCLLNRTAVEYDTSVAVFGNKKPVQYRLEGQKYYRFYDDHNFAWFVICPSTWPTARIKKRCYRCGGTNPVWDFFPMPRHNPLSDATPFTQWKDYIQGYNGNSVYAISWWPGQSKRNVTVFGEKCTQLAVSRPGLRHWTVKFFDEPSYGYVQYKNEWHQDGPELENEAGYGSN